VIYVDKLSIDADSDNLSATGVREKDSRDIQLGLGKHVFNSGEKVTLKFKIDVKYSKSGQGFVLCYKCK